jgi:hypothetical protein
MTEKPGMGLAKLSIGEKTVFEPISNSEGEALLASVHPPYLWEINLDELANSQLELIIEYIIRWNILAYWMCSHRTGRSDTRSEPFTFQCFKDLREISGVYNDLFDLCVATFEAVDVRNFVLTPQEWWASIIHAEQKDKIRQIIASKDKNGDIKIHGITKRALVKGSTNLLKELKAGRIPFEETEDNKFFFRLCNAAINSSKKTCSLEKISCSLSGDDLYQLQKYQRCKLKWEMFLKNWQKLKTKIDKSDQKTIVIMNDALHYHGQHNKLKRILPLVTNSDRDAAIRWIRDVNSKFAICE